MYCLLSRVSRPPQHKVQMKSSKTMVAWLLLYRLLMGQRPKFTRPLRIQATFLHVKAVQAARNSVITLLGLCVLVLFLFTGFMVFHVGLFLYLPGTLAERGFTFICLGGGYVLVWWMRMTGADKAVLRALEK